MTNASLEKNAQLKPVGKIVRLMSYTYKTIPNVNERESMCTNPHLESTKHTKNERAKIERIRGKPIKNKFCTTQSMQKPSTRNPTKQTTKKTINKKSIIFKLFFVCSSAVSSSFRFVFFCFLLRRDGPSTCHWVRRCGWGRCCTIGVPVGWISWVHWWW